MILFNLNHTIRKPSAITWRGNAKLSLLFKIFFFAGIAAFAGSLPFWAQPAESQTPAMTGERDPDAMSFPSYSEMRDEDDILESYPSYLRFVLSIGNSVNRRASKRLAAKYDVLRKYSPTGAAKFLKGLRFEMVQKLQYAHLSPRSVTTSNPKVRAWVGRHLDKWYHEADETLFRAVVYKKTDQRWD